MSPDPFEPRSIEIPEAISSRVKPELAPGERLVWAVESHRRDVPSDRGLGCGVLVMAVAVALSGLCGMAASGMFSRRFPQTEEFLSVVAGASAFVAVVVFVMVLLGLRDRSANRAAQRPSVYALTDRRAIVWKPRPDGPGVGVFSFPRGTIRSVDRVENPDGSGDVLFGPHDFGSHRPTGFTDVAEVRRVEALARRLLLDLPESPDLT